MKSILSAKCFLLLCFIDLGVPQTVSTSTREIMTTSEQASSSSSPVMMTTTLFETTEVQGTSMTENVTDTVNETAFSSTTEEMGTPMSFQFTTQTEIVTSTTKTGGHSTPPKTTPSTTTPKKPIITTLDPLGEERMLEVLQEGLKIFASGASLTQIIKELGGSFPQTLAPLIQEIVTKGMPLFMDGATSELIHVMLADFSKLFAKTDMVALIQRVATMLVDKLLEPRLQTFPNVTHACLVSLDSLIHGIIDLDTWALYMLDATGKPGPGLAKGDTIWMGSKDQCEATRVVLTNKTQALKFVFGNQTVVMRGQYSSIFVNAPEAFVLRLTGGETIPQGFYLQWDVCLPDYCKSDEIHRLAQSIANLAGLPVRNVHAVKPHSPISKDDNAIIAICVLSAIALITICAVTYHATIIHKRKKHEDYIFTNVNGTAYVNGAVTSDDGDVKDKKLTDDSLEAEQQKFSTFTEEETGVIGKLLLSFAFTRNMERTLDTSPRPGSIECLHGIRVLSMGYIMMSNLCYFLSNRNVFQNGLDILFDLHTFMLQPIINGTLATDTFFLLGGTLVSYWFLRDTKRRGGLSFKQMVLYYTHRIWRLTPIYALILMFYYCLFPYFLTGPQDPKVDPDIQNCGESWWTNLLYINNFYKTEKHCMLWTWYSACDMQFYVIAPVILIPLVLFKMVGIVLIFALILVHVICTGIFEYKYGGNIMEPGSVDSHYFQEIFIKPYTRVAPFAIGLLLGYIIHNKNKYRLHWIVAAVGWIFTFGLTVLWTTITYDNNKVFPRNWNRMGQTFHQVFFRPLWALEVAWIIFVCVKGYGGPINSVLSWRGWLPLSRVTYIAYLGHPLIIIIQFFNAHTLFYYNTQSLLFSYASVLFMTYIVALGVYTLLEAPWRCLEEVFFPSSEEATNDDDDVAMKGMSNSKSVFLELKE